MKMNVKRRIGRLFVSAAVAVGTIGCGIIDGGDPETALVQVAGPDGTTLSLVVSNRFTTTPNDDPNSSRRINVDLETSDTLTITVPFEQRYQLGSQLRFYAQVSNEPGAPAADVGMRVLIDNDERYNSSRLVTDEDVLEFVYVLGIFN